MMPWHEPVWRALQRRLAESTMPHAVLITGQPGVGKSLFANRLAKAALCTSPGPDGDACGECRACQWFEAGTHPDCYRVSPEPDSQVIKIDQVRELIRKIALTASGDRLQVFVLEPADQLNAAAANAFLKTLEEPTPNTLILMLASRAHRLPATVRSRCQTYAIALPPDDMALDWLQDRAGLDREAASAALQTAGGAPLLAASAAESGRVERFNETRRDLNELSAGRSDPLTIAGRWAQDEELGLRLDWWYRWLSQQAWARSGADGQPNDGLTVRADFGSLVRYIERLVEARRLLSTTVTVDLLLLDLLTGWRDLAASGE